MPLQSKLKPVLHRKQWEGVTPSLLANVAGSFVVAADMGMQLGRVFEVLGVSAIYAYYSAEDAWLQLPNSGLGGTFGAGACGEFHPDGPAATATGGSTTTIITNLTLARDLRGHKVRFTAGPNAGIEATIASNTIGANAVVTLTAALATAVTAATVFTLRTGRLYVFVPSATAPAFGYYDWALNTWTARVVTGLPTAWATEGQLIGVDSLRSGVWVTATSTAAGTTTTLVDSARNWAVNTWANRAQVRITGGTGAGQVRRIASNTATVLTVATAFTTAPDATSTYVIEGDDDSLYLFGNASVTGYRFSLSGNAWTTLAPVAARTAGGAAGMTADLIGNVVDAAWTSALDPINGKRIYSFRGGASNALDYYDIAANTWVSSLIYGDQFETFTTGTNSVADAERIYVNKDASNRFFYFDVLLNTLRPFSTLLYGVGAATPGDKMAIVKYVDSPATVPFLYFRRTAATEFFRIIAIK